MSNATYETLQQWLDEDVVHAYYPDWLLTETVVREYAGAHPIDGVERVLEKTVDGFHFRYYGVFGKWGEPQWLADEFGYDLVYQGEEGESQLVIGTHTHPTPRATKEEEAEAAEECFYGMARHTSQAFADWYKQQ